MDLVNWIVDVFDVLNDDVVIVCVCDVVSV